MNSLRIIVLAVAVFVILEIYATVTEGRPRRSRLPMIQVSGDEQLRFRPVPNDRHYAYEQPVTLNALGLRGALPAATARNVVIALGESQLYGLGVADEDLATTIAERRLELEGTGARVINAGVRAYSLTQQARLLDELCATYRPAHIVVFVYPFSVRDHPLDWLPLPPATTEPYTLDLGGPADGARLLQWRVRETLRNSAAIAWLWYRVKAWRRDRGLWGAILRGADAPAASRSFEATAQAAGYIAALAAANSATLHFVALPAPSQLVDDDAPRGFQNWLAGIATETGAGFLDLTQSLTQRFDNDGRLPCAPYDDHYDASAHEVMADAIAAVVLAGPRG